MFNISTSLLCALMVLHIYSAQSLFTGEQVRILCFHMPPLFSAAFTLQSAAFKNTQLFWALSVSTLLSVVNCNFERLYGLNIRTYHVSAYTISIPLLLTKFIITKVKSFSIIYFYLTNLGPSFCLLNSFHYSNIKYSGF